MFESYHWHAGVTEWSIVNGCYPFGCYVSRRFKSFLLRWRGNLVWTKGGCLESISIGNYAVSSNLTLSVNIMKHFKNSG